MNKMKNRLRDAEPIRHEKYNRIMLKPQLDHDNSIKPSLNKQHNLNPLNRHTFDLNDSISIEPEVCVKFKKN